MEYTESLQDIVRGSTKQFTARISYTAPDGSAADFTGDSLRLLVKRRRDDADADAVLNVVESISNETVDGETVGEAAYALTTADTNIAPGNYPYEFIWERNDGKNYPMEMGTVQIISRVQDV